ncbi:Os02g0616199 [Oryza sativa Japonica Group]|uniref:Os02g0616199 protein n=1 Tax=Oryza sativa subsp. japonica TaxID=39947 RepID=A0A0P0VLZ1_ORYSJ|nr:Os02g0616199 [Oryza sativa Japonica Group]
MEDGVELDQDLAATREEAEREILNTWIWDKEIDLLQREIEEQDELSRLRHEQEREDDLYVNGRNIFMKYGDGFRYEDGNPYYAADREETWEKQILRQMKFPIPDLSESWEGSLVVEGPFNLDPNLTLTDHLMPALPKWERRWLDRDGKEPCRRAIQVLGLNLSSPSNVPLEIYVHLHSEIHAIVSCATMSLTTQEKTHVNLSRVLIASNL